MSAQHPADPHLLPVHVVVQCSRCREEFEVPLSRGSCRCRGCGQVIPLPRPSMSGLYKAARKEPDK